MEGGGGLLVFIVIAALTIVAFWRILPRAGLSPYWSLVAVVPLGTVILLLVLAFRPWPGDEERVSHGQGQG